MVTYYAAMGRYRLERLEGDVRFPVLMLGGQEYHVSVAEFMVWSSLLWNILNRDALQAESERAAAVFDCSMDEELFERTLSRLLFRGLVVSGEGETGAEALQDLIMKTRLVPIRMRFFRKLQVFLAMLRNGHPFFSAMLVFDRDRLSADEASVWELLDGDAMTAAEVVFCAGQTPESNNAAPTDAQHVMAVLANLYLKRMVVLEST